MKHLLLIFPLLIAAASFPDFDDNDIVDFTDFLLFIEKFGATKGNPHYDPKFDLDSDGTIGFSDFLLFVKDFGKKAPHLAYNIEIIFVDETLSSHQKNIILQAARQWESVIDKDMPDMIFQTITQQGNVTVTINHTLRFYEHIFRDKIDDMVIFVKTEAIPGSVLGKGASFSFTRPPFKRDIPFIGEITLSHELLRNYEDADLYLVALHEMGHVLGIGIPIFENQCASDPFSGPYFPGEKSIEAFNQAGGTDYPYGKVPVEPDLSHWRENILGDELMTPSIYFDRKQPLSLITIQALADLGYPVNVTQAEPYTLPKNN